MKILSPVIIGLFAFGFMLSSCQNTSENEQQAEAETNEASTLAQEEAALEVTTVLNVNIATEEELAALELGKMFTKFILEQRPFLDMNDLDALVDAETDKESLYKKIFVPQNLNTTAEADFKLIPGVGDRMAHEFEEYRPYLNIQQFRKELGKYVDESEVARYEQYVFVPVELNTATEADMKALPGVGDRMAHEFEEYRPYTNMDQFRKEIGKYVDDKELSRLERLVYLKAAE